MNKPHVHAELIKGWADGRKIEFYSTLTNKWEPIESPQWNSTTQYRFSPYPCYVPFTFEDREFLRNKWIRIKGDESEDAIWKINSRGVNGISFDGLLKNHVFSDGSPCGKLTE